LRPAGAAALDRVGVVDAPALAQEIIQPAFAAVRRGFPGDAGQPAAVPHQKRIGAAFVGRQEILHIHLLDLVGTVRIDLRRNAARREHDFLHRLATDFDEPPADMKRAHVAQRDSFGGLC